MARQAMSVVPISLSNLNLNRLLLRYCSLVQRCYRHDLRPPLPHPVFRTYSKLHRIPVRVYQPKPGEFAGKGRESIVKVPVEVSQKKKKVNEPSLEELKTSGELFKTLMGDIFTSKQKSLIAVEGGKLVEDTIRFGIKLRFLFLLKSYKKFPENVDKIVKENDELQSTASDPETQSTPARLVLKNKPEVHRVSLKTLQEWSAMETPPGIIGIFDKPKEAALRETSPIPGNSLQTPPAPLTVILDNIRDPGNLGSILRTAAGIGSKVWLSNGCTNPWDMKSLRGGNGAQFLIQLRTNVDIGTFHNYLNLSDLMPQSDPGSLQSSSSTSSPSGIGLFLADSGGADDKEDEFGLPIVPYTSIQYSNFKSIYLIIGGETSGLSKAAKKATVTLKEMYPESVKLVSRIKIPMCLPVDSLNVANAFGIIGYEIARQFSNNSKN